MDPHELDRQQLRQYNHRLDALLLVPSWLSGALCLLFALAMLSILLVESNYQGGELQQQFLIWHTSGNNSLSLVANVLRQNTLAGNVQVYIFWLAVGTVLYIMWSALYRTIRGADDAWHQLHYVNIRRSVFLRSLYIQLLTRTLSLAAWVGFVALTLQFILPYLLAAIHIADEHLPAIGAVILLFGSMIGLALTAHVHIVLLRLTVGKPRVFHSDEYLIGQSRAH